METVKKASFAGNAGFMYYMKPANLASEIRKYGYEYTLSKTLGMYVAFALGIAGVSLLFKLRLIYALAVWAAGIVILPSIILHTYKKLYEQQRFSDLTMYMEQMLYSFKKNPKILYALKDTLEVFEDERNMMHQAVVRAISVIESSFTKTAVEDGLLEIEKDFKNERLTQIHKLMLRIEKLGGDYDSSIMLMLEADRQWAERTSLQMKAVAKQRRDLIIIIALNIMVCAFVLFALPEDMTITGYALYQISTMCLFIASILIYARIDKKMGINWVSGEDREENVKDLLRQYEKVRTYNPFLEKKKSFKYAQVPLLFILLTALYCIVSGKVNTLCLFLFGGLTIVLYVCVNQHDIGYKMSVKAVTRALEKKFPVWLMEVSLRSQSGNVQRAITDSIDTSPELLRPALMEFADNIEKDPVGLTPYNRFLCEFNVPEIHSAMKMFYSISKGNGGDTDDQITELLSRNNKLMDKAEQIKNEDRLASFMSLQYVVVITGILKLMADMILFFIMFFTNTRI